MIQNEILEDKVISETERPRGRPADGMLSPATHSDCMPLAS